MKPKSEKEEVINLSQWKEKRITKVWECACGCQVFYIHMVGLLECNGCGKRNSVVDFPFDNELIEIVSDG